MKSVISSISEAGMITVNGYKLEPTIFPDGTCQVWKLPRWLRDTYKYWIDWRYESEAELMQLFQLKTLLTGKWYLYIPYLPYARQDKDIDNNTSWALHSFARMLNLLDCDSVTALDVHNDVAAIKNINRFYNKEPYKLHNKVIEEVQPDLIIFPDVGAYNRYPHLHDKTHVVCKKTRDVSTGKIVKYEMPDINLTQYNRALVIDDLCDGGYTFKMLKAELPVGLDVSLFVTHGVFSKGTTDLYCMGYKLYSTDSFIRSDKNFVKVFEV